MGSVDLDFGWRTALLGACVLLCLLMAAGIAADIGHRSANRLLAWALVVVAGLLFPYAIGFAGFYDAFPWITFAPVAIPLALGPLLYGYAHTVVLSRPPQTFARHLVAPALQGLYFAVCFALPMGPKWAWYTGGHRDWIAPAFDIAALVSLALYAWRIRALLALHRQRLADLRSDDDRFSTQWLLRVLVVVLFSLILQCGFWLWAATTGGVNFFEETPLYLALGCAGVYLGVSGWRHAALLGSAQLNLAEAEPPTPRADPDWRTLGLTYEARIRQEGWWREPDFNLNRAARLLGTHAGQVSRAINNGLGVNFSTLINGLRAEAVAQAVQDNPQINLLHTALEVGFSSKASFNRAFKTRFGQPPSQWRRNASNSANLRGA